MRNGFTMIELIFVIAIISIIAASIMGKKDISDVTTDDVKKTIKSAVSSVNPGKYQVLQDENKHLITLTNNMKKRISDIERDNEKLLSELKQCTQSKSDSVDSVTKIDEFETDTFGTGY